MKTEHEEKYGYKNPMEEMSIAHDFVVKALFFLLSISVILNIVLIVTLWKK